ncbi:MAG: prepilin-type N-terminal cleavage/methylation domain-containing protein [Magnetococcus sp. DMHC-6]
MKASNLFLLPKKGFTLLELMVVLVIIGGVTAISLPSFHLYILKSNLEMAKPYLMSIAAKERIYYNRFGNYYASLNEQELEDNLGVDLKDANDFCFVVRSGDNTYISSSGNSGGDDNGDAEFEVWAVLRSAEVGVTSVAVFGLSVLCQTATDKREASGWVSDSLTEVGSAGRVVVLRYPMPHFNQILDTTTRNGRSDLYLDWSESGISMTDALL